MSSTTVARRADTQAPRRLVGRLGITACHDRCPLVYDGRGVFVRRVTRWHRFGFSRCQGLGSGWVGLT